MIFKKQILEKRQLLWNTFITFGDPIYATKFRH